VPKIERMVQGTGFRVQGRKKSIGFVESIESVELKGKHPRGDAVKRVPKVPKIKRTVHGAREKVVY